MYKTYFFFNNKNGRKNMKKIIIMGSIMMLLLTGCNMNMNSPSKKVEEFLSKYQSMDSDVLTQLDNVIADDSSMSDEDKKEYKSLMEKQYQNMSYKIKNEKVDGDIASVDAEVQVYDYATSVQKSKKYYDEHKTEFNGKNEDNDGLVGESAKYIKYKIEQLKNVNDKVKYTITFNLHKDGREWVVDDISDVDLEKIHGLYVQ